MLHNMVCLYVEVPQDLHGVVLTDFISSVLIPAIITFDAVMATQTPMNSCSYFVVATLVVRLGQLHAPTDNVIYSFIFDVAQSAK